MKMRYLFALLFVCSFLGCSTLTPQQTIWCQWERFGRSDYSNFYDEYSKYPDYAIAVYGINENYDTQNDVKHVREAIRLCRQHFGKAFRARKLERENPEDGYTHTFESKPGWRAEIPFDPHFVVIAIQNRAENKGVSSFVSSYKVAYIIPAELVFSRHFDFEKAMRSAFVDRSPFYFDAPPPDAKSWSPAERYKWVAIERHEVYLRENAEQKGVSP